jgi:hypothetical protein
MSACRDPFVDVDYHVSQCFSKEAASIDVLEKWIGEAAVNLVRKEFCQRWENSGKWPSN